MSDLIKDLSLYEIDSLEIVYQLLINDSKVLNETGHGKDNDHIFKYHIPEENREVPPLIRIHPISELPVEYADNEQLAWDCIVQVDVWDYSNARQIALRVHKLMKTINFKQNTPTFEYDPDTYLVRDCRRYRGVLISKLKENE